MLSTEFCLGGIKIYTLMYDFVDLFKIGIINRGFAKCHSHVNGNPLLFFNNFHKNGSLLSQE